MKNKSHDEVSSNWIFYLIIIIFYIALKSHIFFYLTLKLPATTQMWNLTSPCFFLFALCQQMKEPRTTTSVIYKMQ